VTCVTIQDPEKPDSIEGTIKVLAVSFKKIRTVSIKAEKETKKDINIAYGEPNCTNVFIIV
jgi:hypothetical protein